MTAEILSDENAKRALADAMAPAFDAVGALAQPDEAAVAAIGDQADALAALDPLWRAFLAR